MEHARPSRTQMAALATIAKWDDLGSPLTSHRTREGYHTTSMPAVKYSTLDALIRRELVDSSMTAGGWVHHVTTAGRQALRTAKPTEETP